MRNSIVRFILYVAIMLLLFIALYLLYRGLLVLFANAMPPFPRHAML